MYKQGSKIIKRYIVINSLYSFKYDSILIAAILILRNGKLHARDICVFFIYIFKQSMKTALVIPIIELIVLFNVSNVFNASGVFNVFNFIR